MDVTECQVESRILSVLEQDRSWTRYALCDLDEPYRRHARFVLAMQGDRARAVLLVYAPPGLTVLIPCGDPTAVRTIFEKGTVLPPSALLMARPIDMSAIEARYRVDRPVKMLRMVVTAETLQAPPRVDATPVRLGANDLPALQGLYALWHEVSLTGAVTGVLAAKGVRDIILNVHADNGAAIAAYRRLGFTEYMIFPEGGAVLRSGPAVR